MTASSDNKGVNLVIGMWLAVIGCWLGLVWTWALAGIPEKVGYAWAVTNGVLTLIAFAVTVGVGAE